MSAPSRAAEEGRGGRPGRSVPAATLLGRDVEKGLSTPLAPSTAARGGGGLALTKIFFGLPPYFEPQISLRRPLILNKILKNFDQNLYKFSLHTDTMLSLIHI